jgi:DNA-binding transcriptional MocR family regulator
LVLRALEDPNFRKEQQATRNILAERARKAMDVVARPEYREDWEVYPFNAGYFMTLRLKGVTAEELRLHLLEKAGLGTIATGENDLRIAFSSVSLERIEEVFAAIAQGIRTLRAGGRG